MSQIVKMLDAKTSLSKLVHDLEGGGAREFIAARNGHPAARLVPLQSNTVDRGLRIGVATGRLKVPDDIDKCADIAARPFQAG